MRLRFFLILLLGMTGLAAPPEGAPPAGVLPETFAGWRRQALTSGTQAEAADPNLGAALRELGLEGFERADYRRAGGLLRITALRFADATGAYGAFTLYRERRMVKSGVGDAGAADDRRELFVASNLLVDIRFEMVTAMSAAETRRLAELIPRIRGAAAQLPVAPLYLPEPEAAQLVLGPAGYARTRAPLPADRIDFSRSPEIVVGPAGTATLVVVKYPTPAIAAQQLKAAEQWTPPDATLLARSKRIGPLVATIVGAISAGDAAAALERIHYDAQVSWAEPTGMHPKENIGGIVYTSIILAIMIFGATVIAGIAFGGFRVALRRLFPKSFPDPAEEGGLIRLNLRD